MDKPITEQRVNEICQGLINKAQFQNIFRVQTEAHTHNGKDAPRVRYQDIDGTPTVVVPTDVVRGAPNTLQNKIYVGSASGGLIYYYLPDGWTLDRLGTGFYLVTHNLGTLSYVVVANYEVNDIPRALGISKAINSFTITTTNISTGLNENTPFDFIVYQ